MRTVVLHTKNEDGTEGDKYEQEGTDGMSVGEQIDLLMDMCVREDQFVYRVDFLNDPPKGEAEHMPVLRGMVAEE